MPISEICNREVIVLQRNDTILEAAKLMRQHHVGDVLVIEYRDGVLVPAGIVTDRDLWWKSWRRNSIRGSSRWAISWRPTSSR